MTENVETLIVGIWLSLCAACLIVIAVMDMTFTRRKGKDR